MSDRSVTMHDPLCRFKHMVVASTLEDLEGCDCAIIALVRVRDDERCAAMNHPATWSAPDPAAAAGSAAGPADVGGVVTTTGDAIAATGLTLDIHDGDLITDAVLVARVLTPTGTTKLVVSEGGADWITASGLLSLASVIANTADNDDDEEDEDA